MSLAHLTPLAIGAANDNADDGGEARTAQFRADMAVWHARQKAIAAAQRVFAKEHRTVGDWLAAQAPKAPKSTYAKAYYEGGHRMVIDGTPIRVAAHVKGWKAVNRAALCQGSDLEGLLLKSNRKRGYWQPDGDAIELAGNLFNLDPMRFERVAAKKVAEAVSRCRWVALGGGKHEQLPVILLEEHAAKAIAWALHCWGFYHCGEARK